MTSTEPDERTALENEIFEIIREHYDCDGGPEVAHIIADLMAERIQTARATAEKNAIDTLAKAQLNMRPLIALKNGNGKPDGNWYVMVWDDAEQVWNCARYADIVSEAKRQLKAGEE